MVVQNYTKSFLDLQQIRVTKASKKLFTNGEIKIINKIIKLEKLDKTENEVYSRKVKPKINAIIDFYQIALIARAKE